MPGFTRRVKMACGYVYITINHDLEGRPAEIFARLGKAGGCQCALLQGIARTLSILAQESPEALERALASLKGIECPGAQPGERGKVFLSCLDAISKLMKNGRSNQK